jgi:signal recognition particle receptor subunit beta
MNGRRRATQLWELTLRGQFGLIKVDSNQDQNDRRSDDLMRITNRSKSGMESQNERERERERERVKKRK